MQTWKVRLLGNVTDLELLAKDIAIGPFRVRYEEDQGYFYESDTLEKLQSDFEVKTQATIEIACLAGLVKLHYGSSEGLGPDVVYKNNGNGTRTIYIDTVEKIQIRDFMDAKAFRVDENGIFQEVAENPSTRIATRISAAQALAASDGSVAKVLRLLGAKDAITWVGLYRIYEVVEKDAGGQHALEKKAEVDAMLLKRFKHSANSPHVGGDSSRHGSETSDPPKESIDIVRAESFVKQLVKDWLSSKGV